MTVNEAWCRIYSIDGLESVIDFGKFGLSKKPCIMSDTYCFECGSVDPLWHDDRVSSPCNRWQYKMLRSLVSLAQGKEEDMVWSGIAGARP